MNFCEDLELVLLSFWSTYGELESGGADVSWFPSLDLAFSFQFRFIWWDSGGLNCKNGQF